MGTTDDEISAVKFCATLNYHESADKSKLSRNMMTMLQSPDLSVRHFLFSLIISEGIFH